ncbi:MAG: cyclase [Parvicella sp.]|jgi:cyclase
MFSTRVIPSLLLKDGGLVKTVKFSKERYVGDPINAVRIFNEKEVDELVLLDIGATIQKKEPDYDSIKEIVSEAFMPIGYGGGIKNLNQIEKLFKIGIEKIIINSAAFKDEALIKDASDIYGSQSVVVSIDVKKDIWKNYQIYTHSGSQKQKLSVSDAIMKLQDLGAGEIIVNSIDKDGTMSGYDIDLIRQASMNIEIPIVALGGAASVEDFANAIQAGASAVSAGSMFIFQGVHRAVLISYVKSEELEQYLNRI